MFTIFSAFDDRARAKGSRDPLGAEATWSFLGRKIVGNLTTVTANLDNFMIALLCCSHANEQVIDPTKIRERYLRAEQVSAYLKLAANHGSRGFLGITQAKKNFERAKLPLGTSARAQLLASQSAYGLWGLYSSAMEGAGLIAGANRRPTPEGRSLIEQIKRQVGEDNWSAFTHLASGDSLAKEALSAGGLASAFWDALMTPALRSTVVSSLLASQRGGPMQCELFSYAQAFLALNAQTERRSMDFCHWVLNQPNATLELTRAMTRIQTIDPLLKFADVVMAWLQKKEGSSIALIASELQNKMPVMTWRTDWQQEEKLPHRVYLMSLQSAVEKSDAVGVLRTLLAHNRSLMRARGGAAWLEDVAGKLLVRVASDSQNTLDVLAGLGERWRYNYFISSFLCITEQGIA